jgi:hypothetical protein
MGDTQVKQTTIAQTQAADALLATRAAHETAILDKIDFDTKKAREGAEALSHYVFEELGRGQRALEEKDLAVGIERKDDDPAREARDEAASALYSLVTRARPTLEAAIGPKAKLRYGLEGNTPTQADALHEFARRAVELMELEPGVYSDLFGNTVDTANVVALLKPKVTQLKAALDKVKQEGSELNAALLARDAEEARLARMTRAAALLEQALFTLADEEALWAKERSKA